MKVLHLSSERSWRGGEQQIAYLIEELKKFDVVSLVACRNNSGFERYCKKEGIGHISLPFKTSFDIVTAYKIKSFANKEAVDIIHMHSGKSHTIGVLAAFFGAASSLVLSRRVEVGIKKNIFARWKYNHPQIRRILCVSDRIKQKISAEINEPEKCVTVYSGIDLNRFSPEKQTGFLRKKYSLPQDVLLIGNISAVTLEKDHLTFIRTAAKILKKRKDVRFFIIGKGSSENQLKEYVSSEGLDEFIKFTGFLPNIPEVLPELDIFMITSTSEGLGTTVLDAFLSEVPVVATNAGGLPEMVIHKQTGLIASPGDSNMLAAHVLQLLEDKKLRGHVVKNAREKVKEFSKERMADSTYRQYQKIMKDQ